MDIGLAGEKYPSVETGLRRVTLKQSLEGSKKHYQERLDAINKAISLMEENPKLVEMLEAIQRAQ
jgi:hypothetical protein